MEMIRQDADGVCFKWQALLDRTINLPQAFDMIDKKCARPASQHNREKEQPAFGVCAPIATSLDYGTRVRTACAKSPRRLCQVCSASQGDFAHPTMPRSRRERHAG
jgi:hypothetical protein